MEKVMLRFRNTLVAAAVAAAWLPTTAWAAPELGSLAPAAVTIGEVVTASGSVAPAAAGELVRVEQQLGGQWVQVGAQATTAADGSWSVAFAPRRGGAVRAVQLSGSGGESRQLSVSVRPKVLTANRSRGAVLPFLGTTATWRIAPADYPSAMVRAELTIDRRSAGFVRARVRDGVVRVRIPTRGVGRFRVRLVLPATSGFAAAADDRLSFVVRGRSVGPGASRTWVRALRAGLRFRGFHVPRSGGFDHRMADSVIAFHKAYSRPRTSSFAQSDWARLTRRRVLARDRSAPLHIEIDKSRQILMQVKNGKPIAIIHISSGSTGNTPTGRHRVLWKGLYVPSLYGSLLYRSMAFQGAYAIHGYPSVPTTPASHGCVRVPMWIADWLYDHSPVGTPVYIYEGPGSTGASVGRTTDVPELTGVDPEVWADER